MIFFYFECRDSSRKRRDEIKDDDDDDVDADADAAAVVANCEKIWSKKKFWRKKNLISVIF